MQHVQKVSSNLCTQYRDGQDFVYILYVSKETDKGLKKLYEYVKHAPNVYGIGFGVQDSVCTN